MIGRAVQFLAMKEFSHENELVILRAKITQQQQPILNVVKHIKTDIMKNKVVTNKIVVCHPFHLFKIEVII